jgi:DNA-binding transcriptional MerR regulator
LGVDVTVLTLTLNELSKKYTSRLDLILKLSNQGLSNQEVSDYLNTNGIRPLRTKEYTSKLIWATLKKIRQREERTKNTKTFFGKPSFYEKESNNPFL